MKHLPLVLIAVAVLFSPVASYAQGVTGSLKGMQPVLDQVYSQMLPLCSRLIDVGRGIAGFGALWYIGSRLWRQIASAEPVDVYPLLRPFALGMCILLFPAVIAVMNGVMQPIVSATGSMVTGSNKAIEVLLKRKEAAIKSSKYYKMYVGEDGRGNSDLWYKYTHPEDPNREEEGMMEGIGNDMKFWMDKQSYNMKNQIKQWMAEVLELLYAAASLCINTIRTFILIVLAILGPLVFGFAVFDGFQNSLTVWIARYVNIFLWLPVANIFGAILGKIQENMLKLDISQIEASGDTFFSSTDIAYMIFLVIGIAGYFSVPGIANFIVNAGGGNSLLHKVNVYSSQSTQLMQGGVGMAADAFGNDSRRHSGYSSQAMGDYFPDKAGSANSHQVNQLKGN